MRRWAAVLTACALLLPACGWPDAVDDIEVSRDGPLPAAALAPCDREPGPKAGATGPAAGSRRAWITSFLDPGVWVRVDRIDASGARRDREKEFPGSYVTVGGEPDLVAARPATATRLRMDGYVAKGADAALRAGATVRLKLGKGGTPQLALALRADEYAFLGRCANDGDEPAYEFGPHAAAYLTALAGASRAETLRVLGFHGELKDGYAWLRYGTWRTLGPGYTPPAVLRALRRGTFVVRPPASWRGRAQVCAVTYLGGSGCVDLTDPAPRPFYYEPTRPYLQLVVRYPDGALRLLDGTEAGNPQGVRLTLTLAAEPSLRAVRGRAAQADSKRAIRSLRVTAR